MSRSRLLVVDDDPLYRSYLSTVLRKDFIVALASDGAEAVAKATEHTPDCALIDIQMPVMDGLQTLREFRATPALKKVPVIILSADHKRGTVMAAIAGGAVDYLVKDKIDDPTLVARARKALTVLPPVQMMSASPLSPKPAISAQPAAHTPPVRSFDDEAVQSILENWE